MKNNQLLPFERNRYYVGKLLTSADFQIEQSYGRQKRRFLNELMFGSGIVCGLGVYSLDDLSFMVESGVAVDGWGREVAVENSVMSKLSAVEGFESLKSNRAVLCLRYQEEQVNPVYAVSSGSQSEGYEYNRIREGFSLCLRDRSSLSKESPRLSNFLSTGVLYSDSDYSVEITIPAVIPCGQSVRLSVTVTKLSDTDSPISLSVPIQTPSLISDDGKHACLVSAEDLLPAGNKPVTFDYWLAADLLPSADSILMASPEDIGIKVGDSVRAASESFLMKVSVCGLSSSEIVARAIGSVSLEEMSLDNNSDLVELADITLQRTKSAYIIESVIEDGIKNYINTNATAGLREEYGKWYSSKAFAAAPTPAGAAQEEASSSARTYRDATYATGVCEISLPANVKPGQFVYSDEIIHGLGSGIVYVDAGLEYFAEDKKLQSPARNTIYGDPAFFSSEELPVPFCAIAVKVMNDRGSFVIAVRIDSVTPMVVLNVRWDAFLLPSGEEKLKKIEGKSISAVRPTVVLATRESYYFSVNFKNMEPCTLTYELTDKDSGTITPDGIYTAPGKEGIFEVRISCTDMPLISTYAYAVVKKRGAEHEAGPQE